MLPDTIHAVDEWMQQEKCTAVTTVLRQICTGEKIARLVRVIWKQDNSMFVLEQGYRFEHELDRELLALLILTGLAGVVQMTWTPT